jgi:uncharacterized protein YndB with AHSA1/START domain
VDPVSAEVIIDRPREEVFEYLADIANHAEFCDHYLVDWRLTREDSYGVGAGARYKIKTPVRSRYNWGDSTLVEVAPHQIVERGRMGKFNRILTRGVYELRDHSGGATRVTFTFESKPKFLSDRLNEALGARWFKRKSKKSMTRLRDILEEDRGRGTRPSVAGGARKPASAFRFRADLEQQS